MRVDEGRCYTMWIQIFGLYVRPFFGQCTYGKKMNKGRSGMGSANLDNY